MTWLLGALGLTAALDRLGRGAGWRQAGLQLMGLILAQGAFWRAWEATLPGAWGRPLALLGMGMLSLLGGGASARHGARLPLGDLGRFGGLAALGSWLSWGLGGPVGVDPEAWLTHLLLAPLGLLATALLGATGGFLLWGSGHLDAHLATEWWVGRRFLLARTSAVLSTVTGISMAGVALGVWLVLLTLGILGGFEHDLQNKIIGASAHVQLQMPDQSPFVVSPQLEAQLGALRARPELQLRADARLLASEVAIASTSQYTAAQIFGVDMATAPQVIEVLGELPASVRQALADDAQALPTHPPLVLGLEMARSLNVEVGDRVRLVSPILEVLSPLGPTPKTRPFRVAGIFSTHMYEYDAHHAFVSLAAARRFLELQPTQISTIGLQCRDPQGAADVGRAWARLQAGAEVPSPLRLLDWRERNQTLFAALQLEHRVAFVVLIFIVLVASFSIVNTLTLSVLERRRDIAILKAMGASDVSVVKIFVLQGLLIGGVGTLFGGLLGVASLTWLQRVGFAIPGDFYYIDSLPVRLDGVQIVGVLLAAWAMVWIFAVLPSLRSASLHPVEGLRDG